MITQKLKRLSNILKSLCDNVGHYEVVKKTKKYIVWSEEVEDSSLSADDKKEEITIQGSIDLYTTVEFDELIDELAEALTINEIGWELASVQYEDATGYIHYEFIWRV